MAPKNRSPRIKTKVAERLITCDDQSSARAVDLSAMIACSGLSSDNQGRAVQIFDCPFKPLRRAVLNHVDERGACSGRDLGRKHRLSMRERPLDHCLIRRARREVQGLEPDRRIAHALIKQDPDELRQRPGTIRRGADGASIRGVRVSKRISEAPPRAVNLCESLYFEQALNAFVLGILMAGLKQPLIHLLALLRARRNDIREGGGGMCHEVSHEPELQRMDVGYITAVVQIEAFGGILIIEVFDLALRKVSSIDAAAQVCGKRAQVRSGKTER